MILLSSILLVLGYFAVGCYLEIQDQKNWRENELLAGRKILDRYRRYF